MAEPANRLTNPAGGKYYKHPMTEELFDSVTTVLDLVDKNSLKYWAAALAATMAIDHIPQLLTAALNPPCGNTNNRCYLKHGRDVRCERCACGECLDCWHRRLRYKHNAESSRRAQEGSEFHDAVNFWILNSGKMVSLRPEVKPYFDAFLLWVADYGLQPNAPDGQGSWEQTEVTLINREHGYAGTSDGAVWIAAGTPLADQALLWMGASGRALVRVDYKTREKPDEQLYRDMPLQAAAYEACAIALLADGTEVPAPATQARYILQLRPGQDGSPPQYTFKPMLSDDETFQAFLGILTCYRWMTGPGQKAFDPTQPTPITGRYSEWVTAPQVVELPSGALDAEPPGAGPSFDEIWGVPDLPTEPTPAPAPTKTTKATAAKQRAAARESVGQARRDAWAAHSDAQAAADGSRHDKATRQVEQLLGVEPGRPETGRLSEPLPF